MLGVALLERGPQGRGVPSCPPAQGWICGGLGAGLAGTAVQGGICSSGPGTASPPLAGGAQHPLPLRADALASQKSAAGLLQPELSHPTAGGALTALWGLHLCSLGARCLPCALKLLLGGSHQQSLAAPSRLVPGAQQKEGGAVWGQMERGQRGHGELGQCEGCPVRCWHGAAGLGRDRDVGKEQRSGTKPGLAGPSKDLCGWLGTVPRRGLGLGHEQ